MGCWWLDIGRIYYIWVLSSVSLSLKLMYLSFHSQFLESCWWLELIFSKFSFIVSGGDADDWLIDHWTREVSRNRRNNKIPCEEFTNTFEVQFMRVFIFSFWWLYFLEGCWWLELIFSKFSFIVSGGDCWWLMIDHWTQKVSRNILVIKNCDVIHVGHWMTF